MLSGNVPADVNYIIFDNDTVRVDNGSYLDTIDLKDNHYAYLQLSTWKWPSLIYVEKNKDLNIDFRNDSLIVKNDPLNSFLLNIDSLLDLYPLRWDIEEADFRVGIETGLSTNFNKIDSIFKNRDVSAAQINELKDIEKLKVAHRTANFISFQERKGNTINRDIYDFVKEVDLNNPRLEKQKNNRNFQHYYLLDKVDDELTF